MRFFYKGFFILFFSLLATLTFAAPPGGGGGSAPQGGGATSQGSGSAPQGRSPSPQNDVPSPQGDKPAPQGVNNSSKEIQKENPEDFKKNDSLPDNSNKEENPDNLLSPEPPFEERQKSPNNNDSSNKKNMEEKQNNIINYRGSRRLAENEPLIISQVKAVRTNKKNVTIEISFNQNINPRSVSAENFFIDNSVFSSGTRFSFNKKGDKIKVTITSVENSFLLRVQNVLSFDGMMIEPIEVFTQVSN